MKNRKILYYGIGFIAIVGIIFLITTNFKKRNVNSDNPEFAQYITAYTSGIVSKQSPIQLQLTSEVTDQIKDKGKLPEDLVYIRPKVKGSYTIVNNVFEFKPEKGFDSDKEYYVEFNLGKLVKVKKDLKSFNFEFKTIKQAFDFVIEEQKTIDKKTLKYQQVTGYVNTADAAELEKIKSILNVTQDGKKLSVKWTSDIDMVKHYFTIDSIVRSEKATFIKLDWNGNSIDVDKKDKIEIEVPAIGDFRLMSYKVNQFPEQYMQLQFTDPLDERQNLNGLITIQGESGLRYSIEDNLIKVFLQERVGGVKKISVFQGIKNVLGFKLKKDEHFDLAFEAEKPAVRISGEGTILPSGEQGLIFPFEAVNLKAVDITIIKIYENNILQFLQTNEYNGNNNLRQVGKPIIRKKVDLDKFSVADFGVWNRFSIDLSEIIKTEPGAIYRVELSFKKQYSLYQCDPDAESEEGTEDEEEEWTEDNNENTNWDSYENDYNDYYDWYYGYWEDRDDPCRKAYYGMDRMVARNIIASDLGLIAKRSQNGNIHVFLSDLITTKPKPGVSIEIYDYQQQLLSKGETDNEGKAKLSNIEDPYFVIAKFGNQRAYLKINDGSSLSMSRFDVSGEEVQKGVKGFIYGERGVWRPGDTIYSTFILQDQDKTIPNNIPVIFEFTNSRGQLLKKDIQTKNTSGFYTFITSTTENAETGDYNLKVSVGSIEFNKIVKIETIKPNRLKIALDFGKKIIYEGSQEKAVLNVKWLHGAPGKNLNVKVDASLIPIKTEFEKYLDYTFDDPTKTFYSVSEEVLDGTTNENGDIDFTVDLSTSGEAPGMMSASFLTKAFEKGGNFSIDQYTVKYSPYESYTGIRLPKGDKIRGMLLTDKKHTVNIVTLSPDGKPIKESRKIEMKFYEVDWQWWYDASSTSVSNYNFGKSATLLSEGIVSSTNGTATWEIEVQYPNWGRYLVLAKDLVSGHTTGKIVYIDWPGWAGRAQKEDKEGATMLSFISDKAKYNVGETVKITIPSGKDGRALVSIENGTDVIETHWVPTKEGETLFEFKATKEMSPNIYVHVSLLQMHSQTANDLPIRMYGAIPILVEDPDTRLQPVITMPNELESGKSFTINISEKSKKPMTYTLAVVDEGLLDLTRFATPNPWDKFYAKEALGVKTWDMYNEVIGAYAGKIERLLAIGGDGEESSQGKKTANRFKPVVRFYGPFTIGRGENKSHTVKISDYIGSVRTMVIAGSDKAYGSSEKTVPVLKPLMVFGTLPRVLSPGETVKLPVTIFAMKDHIKTVNVLIKTNDLLSIKGNSSKALKFDKPGEENAEFELIVNKKIGIGKIEVVASSGSVSTTYKIEIDVRNPNHPTTHVIEKVLTAGETWNTDYVPVGIDGTNKGILEISSIPPINLERRLNFLIQYPHGCVEQTTSAVFPQLYLADVMDLSKEKKAEIEKNIKMGIKRLESFQVSSGGLSYWQGGADISEWGTSYAGHFIIEAKKKGYTVSGNFIQSWKKYQTNKAKNWTNDGPHSHLDQAYRLYTLALAGYPEMSSMNRLKNIDDLSLAAKWRLAASYFITGKQTIAKSMVSGLSVQIPEYYELAYTYGSDTRDKAMILETLSLLGEKAKAFSILKEISVELSGNLYMSTQTTAYSLLAVAHYIKTSALSESIQYQYSLNSGTGINVSTNKSISQNDLKIKGTSSGKLSIKNTSKGILYARILLQGIPEIGKTTDAQKDLYMTVKYTLPDGSYLSPEKIEQGTDFIAEVTISHPGILKNYNEMSLSQIFPSGWEIINTRLFNTGISSTGISVPEFVDIRDDRVYTYFDLERSKSKTFKVLLNAGYSGRFWMPPVYCEAMYDASIFSQKGGMFVTVE